MDLHMEHATFPHSEAQHASVTSWQRVASDYVSQDPNPQAGHDLQLLRPVRMTSPNINSLRLNVQLPVATTVIGAQGRKRRWTRAVTNPEHAV